MKSHTFALGVALLTASHSWADDPAHTEKAAPQIQFENTTYDFGKIKGGEVVKHSFVFTNTGSATLEILSVKPGCGCTTAGTWDSKVEPGKTGSIPLQFNSSGFGGHVAKSATVTCNDPAHSNVLLQITGTIWKPIDISPTMAVFNFSSEGQTNQTKAIHITSNVDEPITLEPVAITNQAFRTELKTLKPGKEFDLEITAVPPFSGSYVATPIKIKTSSKEMPEISTYAYVTVLPPISILPQQISLPAGALPNESTSQVIIRNNGSTKLTLSDAAINVPGADVTLRETQPGHMYSLAVKFPKGFQIEPGHKVEATVKTDSAKNPVLTIPVMQLPSFNRPVSSVRLATPHPAATK